LRAEKYDCARIISPPRFQYRSFHTSPGLPGAGGRGGCRPSDEHKKRNKKQQSADENAGNSGEPKEWEEEAGAHPAVFGIYAMPKAKEGLGSALGRSFSVNSAAKLKFKTDFQTMKLFCGDKEILRSILAGFR